MFRILVSDKLGAAGLALLEAAEDVSYDMKPGLSPDELKAILPEYDALIIRSGTKATAEIIEAGTKLKVIGRAGIGVDNVDILAATQRGIIVMNTPTANSIATAEQAMTLMLAVSRHTAVAHESLRQGEWRRSEFVGQELYGKTLGIIGFGNIGRLVAQRAQAFGMTVIAYDPYVSEEVGRELGVTLVDLDDLLPEADYITLHTAAVPATIKMINADTIAQMKDGVILVNDARGKLIDEEALLAGLESGKIKAAALDVYSSEPPKDNPLIGHPKVLHTPHLGASTVEAQRAVAEQIVAQVLDALRGTDFRNALNMPFETKGIDFNAIRPFLGLAEKLGKLHAGLAQHPITKLEVAVNGEALNGLVKAVAAGILQGFLADKHDGPINYINAPVLAEQYGIAITQSTTPKETDYPNIISCKAYWDGGERRLDGVLFGNEEPRIVRINRYKLEAKPEGTILLMLNKDVPGVIGQIGTILSAYNVNIGEWRMGRDEPGGEALSVINLDSEPPAPAVDALSKITAVTDIRVVTV